MHLEISATDYAAKREKTAQHIFLGENEISRAREVKVMSWELTGGHLPVPSVQFFTSFLLAHPAKETKLTLG